MKRDLQNGTGQTPAGGAGGEVDAFLAKVAATPPPGHGTARRGRLMFAMDATASRQRSWDQALHIQAEMFETTRSLGGLDIQLLFYRGFGECKASTWFSDAVALRNAMLKVQCLGGRTQIGRILSRALRETRDKPVQAVVFVGDSMEEDADALCHQAGQLGLLKVPLFLFQEGHDADATNVFRQMARLSGGAWCPFDASSADRLKELLAAVAVYAAGGRRALADHGRNSRADIAGLLEQIK
ncbi:MAG: hypothetical protein P1U65_06315 [Minwuia sp.]|nr:hypothetical protein [Minwuia sp.]